MPSKQSHSGESERDCTQYLAPYERALAKGGPRFEALLWASPQSQRARFRTITEMVDLRGRVVLDAGCGRADLARFMIEQGIAYKKYIGMDAIPAWLTACRACELPRAEFVEADFVSASTSFGGGGDADVVVFSGSLNTLEAPRAREVLARAWDSGVGTLVFNFLSTRDRVRPSEDQFRVNRLCPMEMMRWARDRCGDVGIRHDYLQDRDCTIRMSR